MKLWFWFVFELKRGETNVTIRASIEEGGGVVILRGCKTVSSPPSSYHQWNKRAGRYISNMHQSGAVRRLTCAVGGPPDRTQQRPSEGICIWKVVPAAGGAGRTAAGCNRQQASSWALIADQRGTKKARSWACVGSMTSDNGPLIGSEVTTTVFITAGMWPEHRHGARASRPKSRQAASAEPCCLCVITLRAALCLVAS